MSNRLGGSAVSFSRNGVTRMLEYRVSAVRRDGQGSSAQVRQATVELDTSLEGRPDALNPTELLLAALAGCMLKGIERVSPMIHFEFRGVEVRLHAVRQDSPPRIVSIDYELIVDSDETDRRIELLHTNVRKYGTVSNTLDGAVELKGTALRKQVTSDPSAL
jgi:uncharacterized OsmC-like protein